MFSMSPCLKRKSGPGTAPSKIPQSPEVRVDALLNTTQELGTPETAERTSGYFLTKSEYGYVQIPSYRSEQRDRMKALDKREWVRLPLDTQVHHYSCGNRRDAAKSLLVTQKRRSCLKRPNEHFAEFCGTPRSTVSANSDSSTVASCSDTRRVHFRPPSASLDAANEGDDDDAAFVEVFYIDRDECGISLFEYIPMDPEHWRYDCTNSVYAREFLEALSRLESVNNWKQYEVATCRTSFESYIREEQHLDEALRLAGVRQELLNSKNEIAEGVVSTLSICKELLKTKNESAEGVVPASSIRKVSPPAPPAQAWGARMAALFGGVLPCLVV